MNLLTLARAGLRGNPLTHALNVLILGLGLGTVTLLLLVAGGVTDRLTRDAGGIDMVVGAKGSPLQLVLSTVFQADVPTGNIPLADAETLLHNRMIAGGAEISLGDAVRGFRIVGTTPAYLGLYDAHLAEGALWQQPLQAVLGAEAARRLHLGLGAQFTGAHGVNGDGHAHAEFPYTVTGILAPTGSVIDRLVLTSLESIWQIHDHMHGAQAQGSTAPGPPREVTSVLLHVRTPLALVTLPYQINRATPLQAAVPSIEAARLLSLLGLGLGALRAMGLMLIACAGLGMFVALLNRMRERRPELAMLRLLGAKRGELFAIILAEALLLSAAGAILGLLLGHAGAWLLVTWLPPGQALAGLAVHWRTAEWIVPVTALLVGLLAALAPAATAYRTDMAEALEA